MKHRPVNFVFTRIDPTTLEYNLNNNEHEK